MGIDDKIVIKNYKCFGSDGAGFEKILPINVIIGKNNSGKSSLIDLIKYIVHPDDTIIKNGRDKTKSSVLITHKLSINEIKPHFKQNTGGGPIVGNHFEYGKQFEKKLYTYELNENGKEFVNIDSDILRGTEPYFRSIAKAITKPFKDKKFCHITAERDIIPEGDKNIDLETNHMPFNPNGERATNYIQQIITNNKYERGIIEKDLLNGLNEIVEPDLSFYRILIEKNDKNFWELIFEDSNYKRIPLSNMGSGIKTIILVLLNLIAKPKIEDKDPKDYIFAFEELENNIHPGLQRRLYEYIIRYSEKHKTYFFITTHSNVVIDAFGTYSNAQLIHVCYNGDIATTNTLISLDKTKSLLDDLGIKASDLLQSNGIIWVEGPSDRIYLNKWLSILDPSLREGFHYQIMFYGGRLLSNLSFDIDLIDKELIPLLKINTNAFVMIDKDSKRETQRINITKARIQEEIGQNNCWITEGKEIENYLTKRTINKWLENKPKVKKEFIYDKYQKLEDGIKGLFEGKPIIYNTNKKKYAYEIAEHINEEDIDILDLKEKILALIKTIKNWNS